MLELMDFVGGLTTVLGLGEEIAQLFDPGDGSGPTIYLVDPSALERVLEPILGSLLTEIKQVFNQDLANTLGVTPVAAAAGAAQTAHDFLAVDYVNAQLAGMSQAQLWNLLTADTSGPALQELSAQASMMTTWTDNPTSIAQQTTSLALMIYSLIVAIRRERAANAPDLRTRRRELATMRRYAALAVSRVWPLLESVGQARVAAISPSYIFQWVAPSDPGSLQTVQGQGVQYYAYIVTDSWNSGTAQPVLSAWEIAPQVNNAFGPPSINLWLQINTARGYYVNLAQGGSDSDMAQWSQQLTQLVTWGSKFPLVVPVVSSGQPQLTPSLPGLPALLTSLTAPSGWLQGGRTALQNLDQLSLKGHAYVFSNTVAAASQHPVDVGGRLRAGAQTPPLQLPAQGGSLAAMVLSADGTCAYGSFSGPGGTGNGAICQYAITADGTLWPTVLSSVQTAAIPTSLALSPDGQSAYLTAYSPNAQPSVNQVLQCSIGADGSLSLKTPSSVATGAAPSAIALSADGKHAYVTNSAGRTVTHFLVAANGTLSPTSVMVGTGNAPTAIALSADGKSAYVANDGTVWQYSIAADGTLSPQNPASLVTGPGAQSMVLRSDGLSAYVAGVGSSKVFQFSIGTNGTLSPKSPATVTTGNALSAITLSDDGLCAYVACSGDGTVWQYSIASDGTLSAMAPLPATPGQYPATTTQNPATTVQQPAAIMLVPATGPMVPSAPLGVPTTIGPAFSNPSGIAVDPAGNLYVADVHLLGGSSNPVMLQVAPDGTQTTLASGFSQDTGPYSVAVDPAGNVYVADGGVNSNRPVVKVTSGGTGSPTAFGSGFSNPSGVAVDPAGNVYVADTDNNRVVRVAPGGTGTPAPIGSGFQVPNGVAVDPAGNVYVADTGNNRVVRVAPGGSQATVTSGVTGVSTQGPTAVAVDPAGNVYVTDSIGNRVVRVAPGGSQATVTSGLSPYINGGPTAVAVDSAGNLYALAEGNNRVVKVPVSPAASGSAPGSATITWAAPLSDGGAAITGYTVTATDLTTPANGGQTATASPTPATATATATATVIGLTGGDSYTFTVTATNAAGTGPASSSSNPVTATAPTSSP